MKEQIISILQSRMDKCGAQQFWAVAVLTGMNGFLIVQKNSIKTEIPLKAILIVITIATIYGITYLLHRHYDYYRMRAEFVKLLEDEDFAPQSMKTQVSTWKGMSLFGTSFYIFWAIIAWSATIIVYC